MRSIKYGSSTGMSFPRLGYKIALLSWRPASLLSLLNHSFWGNSAAAPKAASSTHPSGEGQPSIMWVQSHKWTQEWIRWPSQALSWLLLRLTAWLQPLRRGSGTRITQLNCSCIPDMENLWEIINVCLFKLLSLGWCVITHTRSTEKDIQEPQWKSRISVQSA